MAASAAIEVELAGVGAGWTDITADRVDTHLRTQSGFQSYKPTDLLASPGVFTFSLDNSNTNSASTRSYYSPDSGSLRAGFAKGIRCRLRQTANGTTRTRFFGWIDDIIPLDGLYGTQVTDVIVSSWLGQALTIPITGLGVQQNRRGDQLLTTLVALAQNQPVGTSFATGPDTYPYGFTDLDPATSMLTDGLMSVAISGLDRIFEQVDGTLVFESRQKRQTRVAANLTITDVSALATPGQALVSTPARRTKGAVINRVDVTVHPFKTDATAVVIWALNVSGQDLTIDAGRTVTLQAPYVDPTNATFQIGAFNTIISTGIGVSGSLPASDYQLTTLAYGAGSDISASMTVTVVFGAVQATITIVNNGAVTGHFAKLQARGQGIYNYQPLLGTYTNATSVTAQGQNKVSVDCVYQADPFFAQSAAKYLGTVGSREVTQIEGGVKVFINANDEVVMNSFFQIDVSSVLALTETMTGLLLGLYWVNGVIQDIDERDNVELTFPVAPMSSTTSWTLGVSGSSELGTTTILGF